MRYEGVVYRPPSEADSLLIQATIGCPHNKCSFCSMYKSTRFRVRSVEAIKEDLDMARAYYGEGVRSVFFPDGNTIIMKTDQLVEIFEYTRSLFPRLERITLYGAARFVRLKSPADMARLKAAGLSRIHMGMESGDADTLLYLRKGSTPSEIIEAGQKVKAAGIELSEYYLVGAGGTARSLEHALGSAAVLNAIEPDFIRLRTLVPVPGTPLYEDMEKGLFELPSPHQALKEIRALVEALSSPGSQVVSDHVSNYWDVSGVIPDDRERMLKSLDYALTIDERRFIRASYTHL